MTTFTLPEQQTSSEQTSATPLSAEPHLQFLLHLSDPAHKLTHTTVTQAVPARWLELWEKYVWVEDLVAEALRVGVEVIGQDYIVARMGWGSKNKTEDKGIDDESDYNIVNEKASET
jgi:Family of unknown function (DUF5427)